MKTAVITGANRGIGLALCKEYLAQGWHVIGVCRAASAELSATDATIITEIDVSNGEAVTRLETQLANVDIDLLINNAGVLHHDNLDVLDYTAINHQFCVNALAPLRVTEALLPRVLTGGKIAFITSRMGSIADNTSGGYYGYRMSKAALNAAATSLAIDLKSREIAVGILHPGFVQTAMVDFGGEITPEESARRLFKRIDQLSMENTGGFWHSNGERLPW